MGALAKIRLQLRCPFLQQSLEQGPQTPQPRINSFLLCNEDSSLFPPDLVLTWMFRQDRQSGTITRKQEEVGGGRGTEGQHYIEGVKKRGWGRLKVGP